MERGKKRGKKKQALIEDLLYNAHIQFQHRQFEKALSLLKRAKIHKMGVIVPWKDQIQKLEKECFVEIRNVELFVLAQHCIQEGKQKEALEKLNQINKTSFLFGLASQLKQEIQIKDK